jgi:hypothetical protein
MLQGKRGNARKRRTLEGRRGRPIGQLMSVGCPHLGAIRAVVPRTPQGCEECLQIGSPWVHLRLCLTCGHVGCCDSSPLRHARAHAHTISHPIVSSLEPGESWRWCYADEIYV